MTEPLDFSKHYASSLDALDAAEMAVLPEGSAQRAAEEENKLSAKTGGRAARWYGGHRSLGSALKAGRTGVDVVTGMLALSDAMVGHAKRRAFVNDIAGGAVDVGRYLQGVPDHMTRFVPRPSPLMIRIGVRGDASGGVSAHELRAHGIKMLACVRALEESGARVSLDIVFAACASTSRYSRCYVSVRLKDFGCPSDPQSVAYWLADPGAFRWVVFKLLRSLVPPDIYARDWDGTGRPDNPPHDWLAARYDVFFPGAEGVDSGKTAEEMAEAALTAARERARIGPQ